MFKKKTTTDTIRFHVTPYTYSSSNANSLISNRAYNLCEDENGCIWVGTSEGLCRINPTSAEILRFNTKNGLPEETICGILSDGK